MEIEQKSPYLDVVLLQGYLDSLGKTVLEKMIALYCQQVNIYLEDIASAQARNAVDDWQIHCHKMKGACASVGMLNLHGKLKIMEKTEASQQDKLVLIDDLVRENEQSILAFTSWLNAN